jgi:hypothetical protein
MVVLSPGQLTAMLKFDDHRWRELEGGYRVPFDPRPLLANLRTGRRVAASWASLWEELHHQGDVGAASYAAVPHLVSIHRRHGRADWNTYALVAMIELARTTGKNPKIPKFLQQSYFRSIRELAELGAREILKAKNPDTIRAVLSVVAMAKGARTHAKSLISYSDQELAEIEATATRITS